jgi:hypothetical protein
MTQNINVFEQGSLVQFKVSLWGAKVKLPTEQIHAEADPDFVRGTKYLVEKSFLRPIEQERNAARGYLRAHSLPFPISGICFVPRNFVPQIEERLQGYRDNFMRQVEVFADQYENAKLNARLRLNGLFDESDYPEQLQSFFSFQWQFFVMDAPSRMSILDPAIYQREQERFAEKMNEFRENAVIVLRERFIEMVNRMVDRLSGEKKIFRNSTIANIQDFLTSFDQLNISNDQDLEREVARCREILAGVDPNSLRSDDNYKDHIARKMSEVQQQLGSMMTERPRRLVWLDPEEELQEEPEKRAA